MSTAAADAGTRAEPASVWRRCVFTLDPQRIGLQFLFTAFGFLAVGGATAMLMRWQLAYPGTPAPWIVRGLFGGAFFFSPDGSIPADAYLKLVTLHGTIMIFFVIFPILVGAFGSLLVPLQIGARHMAFPRLHALSFWLFLTGGVVLLLGLFADHGAAAAGWTSYPPLSVLASMDPGSGLGQTCWIAALALVGCASMAGGLNVVVTVVRLRAPGMSWGRLPLATWAQFIVAWFHTIATPVLLVALVLLFSDQALQGSHFLPAGVFSSDNQALDRPGGGDPLLWQRLFWFYTHPALYALILPCMGIVSELISTAARNPIVHYRGMVAAMIALLALGFLVWGQHLVVSGAGPGMASFFMTTALLAALPTVILLGNLVATLWRGSLRFTTSALWAYAFLATFALGGLSGLFLASATVNVQAHETYHVVAHIHAIAFGGALFAVFGGLTFWFPRWFGRRMSEFWGVVHWAVTFLAFQLTFLPMHLLGEAGHLRRLPSAVEKYEFLQPIQWLNVFVSHAAFLLGAVQIVFLVNFLWSMRRGAPAGSNPWGATTLEWAQLATPAQPGDCAAPTVYRGPYEYARGRVEDGMDEAVPQDHPVEMAS